MPDPETTNSAVLLVDRKFTAEQLKIRRHQAYAADLTQCFRVFRKWGYDIIWVDSGADAMKALRRHGGRVACVLIEAYMPGNGKTMARMLRLKPDAAAIPVVLMSAQFTPVDLQEATRIGVADCLPKPFSDPEGLEEKLKAVLEAARRTPAPSPSASDRVKHILRELDKITDLPAMPTVFSEIERLSQNPRSTTEEYSAVIELDVSITSQLLRLSNSSAFSFTRKINTVADAVNLLGLKTVVNYVRTLSVVGAFRRHSQAVFDVREFWLHAIACGVAARILAGRPEILKALPLGDTDPFMAGMVHDIGKMIFGYFFTELFRTVADAVQAEGRPMFEVETEILGITHAEVGGALATRWRLPETLSGVIQGHHEPAAADSPVTVLVHLANASCKSMGFPFKERKADLSVSPAALERVGMDPPVLAGLLSGLEAEIRSGVSDTFSAIFK